MVVTIKTRRIYLTRRDSQGPWLVGSVLLAATVGVVPGDSTLVAQK